MITITTTVMYDYEGNIMVFWTSVALPSDNRVWRQMTTRGL